MRYPVVLDLETKHSFKEFSEHKKLGISVVCIYDYADNQLKAYFEHELNTLFPVLENASIIIGFNHESFDMPVLQAYYPGDVKQFKTFDLLEDIRQKIGRRLALNDLISATLGKKKTGHGLQAIDLYREGKLDELKSYCMADVDLTRQLFEHGVKQEEVNFMDVTGKSTLKVSWKKYTKENQANSISLTLPF